ncbi:MAG TPA: fumarylacetoacetate hydrolase family protein [Rhodopila sp.]
MDQNDIAAASDLLAAARRQHARIDRLPDAVRPRTVADAHAIQDAVTVRLGERVFAFKGSAPGRNAAEAVRAPIYATACFPSPAQVPAATVPQCGIEGEVAFRFRRDLPPRATPYSRQEVVDAIDACAAIELVTSRFADPDSTTFLEKLADCSSNGGFVFAPVVEDWHRLDFTSLKVKLEINGETVLEQAGGHPTGDLLNIVTSFVELMRTSTGVPAGQFITCGSYTGLRYLDPGDRCAVTFDGLGRVESVFQT